MNKDQIKKTDEYTNSGALQRIGKIIGRDFREIPSELNQYVFKRDCLIDYGTSQVLEGDKEIRKHFEKVFESETKKCRWCETVINTGTGQCDRCWELQRRVETDITLAKKMLAELNNIDEKRKTCEKVPAVKLILEN